MHEPPSMPELQGSNGEATDVAVDQARFSAEVAEAVNVSLKVTIRKTVHQEHSALLKQIKELFREELRTASQLREPLTQAGPHGDAGLKSHVSHMSQMSQQMSQQLRRVSLTPSENTGSTGSCSLESVPNSGKKLDTDVKTLQMRVDDKILGASSLMMGATSHGRASPHDEHGGQHDSVAANAAPTRSAKRASSGGLKHLEQRAVAAKSVAAKDEPSPPKQPKLKSVMPAPEDDKPKSFDVSPIGFGAVAADLGSTAPQDGTQIEDDKLRQFELAPSAKQGVSSENTEMSRPKTFGGAPSIKTASCVASDDSRTSADFSNPIFSDDSRTSADFMKQNSHGQSSEQNRHFSKYHSNNSQSTMRDYASGPAYGESEESKLHSSTSPAISPVVSPSVSIGVEDMIRIRSSELTERFQALGSLSSNNKLTPKHSSTIHTLEAIEEARRGSGLRPDDTSSASAGYDHDYVPTFSMPKVLTVCGILPHRLQQGVSRFYCWFLMYCWLVVILAILSCSALVYQSIHQPEFCSKSPNLADLPLAFGGVLCLFSLTFWRQASEIQKSYLLLYIYAERHNLLMKLRRTIGWDSAVMVLLWVLVVLSHIRTSGFFCALSSNSSVDAWEVLLVIAHTVCTGLLLGACFCILNVSRGMAAMIDHFCLQAMQVDQPDILTCVGAWNVLQAVIRRVSGALERCFFLVQAVAALIVLLSVVDFFRQSGATAHDLIDLIPGVLVMCYILRIFFAAVQVTDKSLRVAPLITSLTDGDFVDKQRQFVVQHIVSSAAGFYVFDVCLTTSMAFKFTYFCGVVFLGLVARVVSSTTY